VPPYDAEVAAHVRVDRLARYPVKACAPELLELAELGPAGLRHDRVLAVTVDEEIVTQREHAQLARVRPALDDATRLLRLAFDGLDDVAATVSADGPTRTVTIFGQPVEVVDQAPELAAWFGEVLGCDARLVMAPDRTRRRTPGVRSGQTVLSDEGAVSLHSQASLDELNTRLAGRGHPPLPAERFRANLVLDGCSAHAEDAASTISVGDVTLGFAQTDERCAVTTVDQQAGRRAGPEPLRTLATYRRAEGGGGVHFGVYLTVETPGTVRLGDPVVLHGS
jgi:MOSC domain-containing protein